MKCAEDAIVFLESVTFSIYIVTMKLFQALFLIIIPLTYSKVIVAENEMVEFEFPHMTVVSAE